MNTYERISSPLLRSSGKVTAAITLGIALTAIAPTTARAEQNPQQGPPHSAAADDQDETDAERSPPVAGVDIESPDTAGTEDQKLSKGVGGRILSTTAGGLTATVVGPLALGALAGGAGLALAISMGGRPMIAYPLVIFSTLGGGLLGAPLAPIGAALGGLGYDWDAPGVASAVVSGLAGLVVLVGVASAGIAVSASEVEGSLYPGLGVVATAPIAAAATTAIGYNIRQPAIAELSAQE